MRLLALAPTPTFALLAVLSAGQENPMCSAFHSSPLTGMVSMYVLMSVFHAAPWLKILTRSRDSIPRAEGF